MRHTKGFSLLLIFTLLSGACGRERTDAVPTSSSDNYGMGDENDLSGLGGLGGLGGQDDTGDLSGLTNDGGNSSIPQSIDDSAGMSELVGPQEAASIAPNLSSLFQSLKGEPGTGTNPLLAKLAQLQSQLRNQPRGKNGLIMALFILLIAKNCKNGAKKSGKSQIGMCILTTLKTVAPKLKALAGQMDGTAFGILKKQAL